MAVSIAVKVCKDTADADGLSSSLLVFGVILRLPLSPRELPTQTERTKAIKAAREEISRLAALDRIKRALTKRVPAAVDEVLVECCEVLMY